MSIRKKILLYFSVVIIGLLGIVFFFIYTLFYEYREEGFQQQQKDKIRTTLKFLTEIKEVDEQLIEAMDQLTINDLYDEKLLIFDKDQKLIYSSIDDTAIPFYKTILEELSPQNQWVEQKDGLYDVIGVYLEREGKRYYGISKAYDVTGYQNLDFLKYVLTLTFISILLVIIIVSYYLSKKITNPIVALTSQINDYEFEGNPHSNLSPVTKNEVAILTQRFNELMKRMNEAFSFQKHAVHHISHQLKTPIAVLVSNFERIEKERDIERIQEMIRNQKEETMDLSEIINSLLEIAKAESGKISLQSLIRIDELIFDLADELHAIYPHFQFSIEYAQIIENENHLSVMANEHLLKASLSNLMVNCIQYSSDHKASIFIKSEGGKLQISFINNGSTINEKEYPYMFQHFFRGENSKGKRGFGLGLVLVHKVLALHGGNIIYRQENPNSNKFTISLPLS